MSEAVTNQVIGGYELQSVAAAGGMGIIYKARQRALGRIVAVKVIRDEIARTPEYRERFLREARLAASLDHPHIVPVYDVIADEDRLGLVMQWVDGEDLRRLIDRVGALAPERAVRIVCEIAGALDAVHTAAGLVHRDVKPGNVLVRPVGGLDHAYLTDFGVAKPSGTLDQLTQTGWVVGTTGYLSPEQIRGQEPGPRSDLYSLGCLFFEALTGKPPFTGDNEWAVRWAHANDPRPLPSSVVPTLGPRYDRFIQSALAVDPGERFASGREFADALAAAHSASAPTAVAVPHTPTAVGPPTPLPPEAPHIPPPSHGYQTPAPMAPAQGKSSSSLALIILGLVALAGIAVGALAAAGVFSHAAARRITPVSSSHRIANVKKSSRAAAAPPSARTSCGGDLSVGPGTSCAFARNVESAYDQTSGGDQAVTAYSPASGQNYTIDCGGGSPHVCSGGTAHGESLYFTSGPAAPSTPSSVPEGSSGSSGSSGSCAEGPCMLASLPTHCSRGLWATQYVSCGLASNVFYEYYKASQTGGDASTLAAWSPVTQRYYGADCSSGDGVITCAILGTGDPNAEVGITQTAMNAYTPQEASSYAANADLGPDG